MNTSQLIRKLASMIPSERLDDAHLAIGECLVDSAPKPKPVQWYKRHSMSFKAQRRRAQKLISFVESVDRELTPTPAGETEREARVRILTDALERCRMFDRAGLKLKTLDGHDSTYNLQRQLERMLTDARIDVRAERGDW